jgi:hypothetical protein
MKLRLVFTTLGPLTLGLLLAAYSPSAHADTVTVFGTPGFDGGHGGNPTRFSPRHFRARHFVLLRYKNANGRTRRLGDYTAWGGLGCLVFDLREQQARELLGERLEVFAVGGFFHVQDAGNDAARHAGVIKSEAVVAVIVDG